MPAYSLKMMPAKGQFVGFAMISLRMLSSPSAVTSLTENASSSI